MIPYPNLPQALASSARDSPASSLSILDRRGRTVGRRTYVEVLESAKQTAARLWAQSIRPGDRILVALPTSFNWFDVWLGAIFLGALPVATAPGAAVGASQVQLAKLIGVVARLDARLIVSTQGLAEKLTAQARAAAGPQIGSFARRGRWDACATPTS